MAAKKGKEKTFNIRFESQVTQSFRDFGLQYYKDKNTGESIPNEMIRPFEIQNGQSITIDEETYEYLRAKGAILTKAEKAEQDRLRKKFLRKKSGRAEPKKEMQIIPAAEKSMIFNDIPFEV